MAVSGRRFPVSTLSPFSCPQFENNDQQDSQECLTVLMEGLGEDLNRVRTKPYIENPDSNGRPDPVVAEEWWTAHLARERSIMLLFQVWGEAVCL